MKKWNSTDKYLKSIKLLKTCHRASQAHNANLKVESAILVIAAVCVFLTFHFLLLSFTSPEDAWRIQFVNLAVYSLMTGIATFACLYIVFKSFAKTVFG